MTEDTECVSVRSGTKVNVYNKVIQNLTTCITTCITTALKHAEIFQKMKNTQNKCGVNQPSMWPGYVCDEWLVTSVERA